MQGFTSVEQVGQFVANDVIDVLGKTIAELTEKLHNIGADVTDLDYMDEEWHQELAVKFQ